MENQENALACKIVVNEDENKLFVRFSEEFTSSDIFELKVTTKILILM